MICVSNGVLIIKFDTHEAMRNINELYEKHFTHEREQKAK